MIWSTASVAFLALAAVANGHQIKRQDGPVDPSTDRDCSFYDTAYDSSYNCAYFESFWGLSHATFVAWNPSVRDDCSGLKVGNSYCVEVTRPTTTTTTTPTASPKPSPTQEGLIESCTTFYKAVRGDNCDKIVAQYGTFTNAQFLQWNPAVGSDCSGLYAETYYCVGVPGTPTTRPTTTTTTTRPTNGITTPTPTQQGMVDNCDAFYFVQSGDGCQAIADKHGITLAQFTSWQNVGGSSCSGLYASVYVCVSIVGHTPSSTSRTTTSTKPTNGITTPTPTQPGMVDNCDAFYFVQSGDGCQVIADKNGITLAQFTSWQNVGGSSCSGLYANVYVCVSIIGHTPSTTTRTSTTTTPTNGITTPTPTQPGMVNNCDSFYLVKSGDGCQAIADKNGITLAQFTSWQNVGGTSCPNLQANVYVCVSIIGHSPTFSTTTKTPTSTTCPTAHPSPTQPGGVCNCKRWHQVASGNTCASIQNQYRITAQQFNSWNPEVGSNCARLWLGYYVCVSA